VACALCVVLAAMQPAGSAFGQAPHTARAALSNAIAPTAAGLIVGSVWGHDNLPVANPLVRLRDLSSGRIVRGAEGDADGRFTFERIPAGSYLVELVNDRGGVVAVGHMFSLGPTETISTFIRLTSRPGWFDGFFSNAAAAALSAAAALGVTAVGNGTQPASARF
jgi:hypothetical protein